MPYTVFRKSDAGIQIGIAMVLMLLWIQFAVGIVLGVVRRRVSLWWLPLMLWVVVCEFYLCQCLNGYIQDITRYVTESHRVANSVLLGDRAHLARTGRRPAGQIGRNESTPNGLAFALAGAIGGTPMAATGTVAIPIPTASFRFSARLTE